MTSDRIVALHPFGAYTSFFGMGPIFMRPAPAPPNRAPGVVGK